MLVVLQYTVVLDAKRALNKNMLKDPRCVHAQMNHMHVVLQLRRSSSTTVL